MKRLFSQLNARPLKSAVLIFFALQLSSSSRPQALAQALAPFDRDNAQAMLNAAKEDLKKNYYDPQLHGLDLDSHFKAAEARLKKATTRDQLLVAVAQTMLELDDSHTFLMPPPRAASVEYGWQMMIIGETAFVNAVKPKSDAEAKGLKAGDAIISIDGYRPTRENMWKMYYRYYALMPARSIRLVVKSPTESQPRELEVVAKIEARKRVVDWLDIFDRAIREGWDVYHDRFYEVGVDLMVWQMPTFVIDDDHVDAIMARAQKFKALVIDLRGNGGGYEKALTRLLGLFFDHDVKVAELKARKEMKPILAKTHGQTFKGPLVVLVDSDSGSASELFARVIQLEKRGTVIGDRTAGAVMIAKHYPHQSGVGSVLYFGTSITIADMVMSDGKSLEKMGVRPDELILPTGADLGAKRDPVLAHAAALVGVKLDPEKAGSLFPKEWRKQ
jgi:C-terminal processing protease CtpA/Prc